MLRLMKAKFSLNVVAYSLFSKIPNKKVLIITYVKFHVRFPEEYLFFY